MSNSMGYSSPNYLDLKYFFIMVFCLLFMATTSWASSRTPSSVKKVRFKERGLDFLFLGCFGGYLAWFGPICLLHPGLVMDAMLGVAGATFEIRDLNATISGVTTLTQFGIPYVCIYMIKRYVQMERLPIRQTIFFGLILFMAAFRAQVNSERLSLLELLIPAICVYSRTIFSYKYRPISFFCRKFPLLTILGAPIFFAIFEYSRSWSTTYRYMYDNIFSFAFERVAIYYVSALNNICGYIQSLQEPTFSGEFTFYWLYRFPIIGKLISPETSAEVKSLSLLNFNYMKFLMGSADIEYNNATGVLVAVADWGVLGALLYFAAYGYVVGKAYRRSIDCKGLLQYLFPILVCALFDIVRITYVADGRFIAALIGMTITYIFWGYKVSEELEPDTLQNR